MTPEETALVGTKWDTGLLGLGVVTVVRFEPANWAGPVRMATVITDNGNARHLDASWFLDPENIYNKEYNFRQVIT